MLLQGLLDPLVATAEALIGAFPPTLPIEEEMAIRGAVVRRRREFAAGRSCARAAMQRFGLQGAPVPMGADRAPVWPDGVVGSISHCETRCVAAVALKADGIRAIGVDIEAAAPLEEDLALEICTELERSWLASQAESERGHLLRAIFSAKECTYKCQYPITGQLIGFDALGIDLDIENGTFTASFQKDVLPYRMGDQLCGRIRIADSHIVTAMSVGVHEA
jgi:4'-phosphopantetheinyl transferase EntD